MGLGTDILNALFKVGHDYSEAQAVLDRYDIRLDRYGNPIVFIDGVWWPVHYDGYKYFIVDGYGQRWNL